MAFLTASERAFLEKSFPKLNASGYVVTSPQTTDYNCVAWAMGEDMKRWWPDVSDHYWPLAVQGRLLIEEFVLMLKAQGFECCDDGKLEEGFEKVVLYARDPSVPTHIARQLPEGSWTSKLGGFVDLTHGVDGLTGAEYGSIYAFYRRPIVGHVEAQ